MKDYYSKTLKAHVTKKHGKIRVNFSDLGVKLKFSPMIIDNEYCFGMSILYRGDFIPASETMYQSYRIIADWLKNQPCDGFEWGERQEDALKSIKQKLESLIGIRTTTCTSAETDPAAEKDLGILPMLTEDKMAFLENVLENVSDGARKEVLESLQKTVHDVVDQVGPGDVVADEDDCVYMVLFRDGDKLSIVSTGDENRFYQTDISDVALTGDHIPAFDSALAAFDDYCCKKCG